MVVMMMIGSAGMHLLQPVQGAIALSIGDEGSRGRRMGLMGAVGTIGAVAGAGFVWLFFDRDAPQYQIGFLCAGAAAAIAAVAYWLMHLPEMHQPRLRLVVRKRFWLYYVLEFLFGARKQIFITFGFWVLIKVYDQPAPYIAGLLMAASLIGIVFKPLVGSAIDHLGERAVMIADGILLAVVCLGYGYADKLTSNPDTALRVASACFIADNLLFALGSGRSVYVSRLTESAQELTSTLAMGVSINHIASMVIPAIGGTIWMALGYERVFVCAAALALGISAVSAFVPKRDTLREE
jgi:predicted MFS family arabinose efflux permease